MRPRRQGALSTGPSGCPSCPAASWPSTLQKNVYLPGLRSSEQRACCNRSADRLAAADLARRSGSSMHTSWDDRGRVVEVDRHGSRPWPLSCSVSYAIARRIGGELHRRRLRPPRGRGRRAAGGGRSLAAGGRLGGLRLGLLGLALVLLLAGVQDRERGRRGHHRRRSRRSAPARTPRVGGKPSQRRPTAETASAETHQRDPEDVEQGLVHAAGILVVAFAGPRERPSPQLAYEVARLSRITVILTWPGYSISLSIAAAISCESSAAALVVHLAGIDDHPDLAPRSHRVDALDAVVARGDLLELAQPLDVLLQRVAAGAGTRPGERVRDLNDHRLDGARLDLVVMCLDRVRDRLGLAVAARRCGRRPARAGPRPRGSRPCRCRAAARARRAVSTDAPSSAAIRPGELRALDQVVEDVLPVAGAELELAEQPHQLRVERRARAPRASPARPPPRFARRSRPWRARSVSSISAGLIRPSAISRSRVIRAISRRTPSKLESITADGVSSMITSTPVSFSSARMLRPSRPMIRPFISSLGSSTRRVVLSPACLAASRCIATERMLRARRSASRLVSALDLLKPAARPGAGPPAPRRRPGAASPGRRSAPRSAPARAAARAWRASAPRPAGPGCAHDPRAPAGAARGRRAAPPATPPRAEPAPPSARSPRDALELVGRRALRARALGPARVARARPPPRLQQRAYLHRHLSLGRGRPNSFARRSAASWTRRATGGAGDTHVRYRATVA